MTKSINLFNEMSTVGYFSEYLTKCFSQVLDKDIIHLSEEEIKKRAKALANKSKIEEIPLSIFDECKRLDPPIPKWVSNMEFDGGGSDFLFIRYQINHSVQNQGLFELYPKNFHGNIIDKRHSEITKNYMEFDIDSEHCCENIPAHKIPVIVQKKDKVIGDMKIKVVGINDEISEFNKELENEFLIFLTNMKKDLDDKKNRFKGLLISK